MLMCLFHFFSLPLPQALGSPTPLREVPEDFQNDFDFQKCRVKNYENYLVY